MGLNCFQRVLALFLVVSGLACHASLPPSSLPREKARHHVNLGVAYLAQFLPGRARKEFLAALADDPENLSATVNLGVTARITADLPEARQWLERALRLDGNNLTALYNLALVDRLAGDAAAAIEKLQRVKQMDPGDIETRYHLGLAYAQTRHPERALAEFAEVLKRNPSHASALYGKGRALLALGREEEALQVLKSSQALSGGQMTTTAGQRYGEQGRYSLALEDMPLDPLAGEFRPVVLTDVTEQSGLHVVMGEGPRLADGERIGVGVGLADLNGDGHLDLYLPDGDGPNHLYLNDGTGLFAAVEAGGGAGSPARATGVTVGDYDNDGRPDLFVGGWTGSRLYRNLGGGHFRDQTIVAGVGEGKQVLSVCFADLDHDGDLDLLVARSAKRLLHYRNNGDGTFKEIGVESGLARAAPAIGLLAIDLDLDRDVDLVTTGPQGVEVFLNDRDLTFSQDTTGWEPRGAPGLRGVVALDLHKDGRPDLVFSGPPGAPGIGLWENTGSRFVHHAAALPGLSDVSSFGLAGLDIDLDGFEDLAVVSSEGLRIYGNRGAGRFTDLSRRMGEVMERASGGRGLQSGDLDGDGAPELVLSRPGRPPLLIHSSGVSKRQWIAVDLEGRSSNRTGIGARVALRSGSLWEQRQVTGSGGYLGSGPPRVLFGLEDRRSVDAISILWPGGVLQDELQVRPGRVNAIKELNRKGSSCPTLFGWDGHQFAYLADFVGGGALGLVLAPGEIYTPDPEELHMVRGEIGLQPDANGKLSLRLTDNLEEVTYLDRIFLRAVDHPQNTHALPLEGLRPAPPYPAPKLHLLQDLMAPVAVRDGAGLDWTAALKSVDRIYPEFSMGKRQGQAQLHDLLVTFPQVPDGAGTLWLWAHGSLAYSNSSPNVAAAQEPRTLVWPRLSWLAPDGSAHLLDAAMPVPMGVDKPVLVALKGPFPAGPLTLRIRTTLAISWDRMALGRERPHPGTPASLRITDLEPSRAVLRPLGFPLWRSPDGRRPKTFDYTRIQPLDSWKKIPGRYTRFGPVGELLSAVDDRHVVMAAGDELALEFDPSPLPPLQPGMMRSWMVYGFGYVKDTDLNSPGSGRVNPLPFVNMGPYPPSDAAYGQDPARARAISRFNTRVVPPGDPLRQQPVAAAIAPDPEGR